MTELQELFSGAHVTVVNVPPGAVMFVRLPPYEALTASHMEDVAKIIKNRLAPTSLKDTEVLVVCDGVEIGFAVKETT